MSLRGRAGLGSGNEHRFHRLGCAGEGIGRRCPLGRRGRLSQSRRAAITRELHAHCYRMLGSVHDADDALQDSLLRAWRGLSRFEGRSSLRSWLLHGSPPTPASTRSPRRPKRVLPIDYRPAGRPRRRSGRAARRVGVVGALSRTQRLGLEDGFAAPEARYERRESVELAFIAALQYLLPRQRAVLILREVLGFSAREVAETLSTTTAAVNSTLQRARAAVAERLPEESQQHTLRDLGDERIRALVEGFVDAWDRGDVETMVAMLAEDARFAMPPFACWYRGQDAITAFLPAAPGLWLLIPTRANAATSRSARIAGIPKHGPTARRSWTCLPSAGHRSPRSPRSRPRVSSSASGCRSRYPPSARCVAWK